MKEKAYFSPECEICYQTIHDFFDLFELPPAVKRLDEIFMAACNEKYRDWGVPFRVVFLLEKIEGLGKAAFVIQANFYHIKKAICFDAIKRSGFPDIRKQGLYVHPHQQVTVWECFPRHLSANQFANPYKVLKNYTTKYTESEWSSIFKDLVEYALSSSSISGSYDIAEILRIRKLLFQFIEACHLLEVRTYQKS